MKSFFAGLILFVCCLAYIHSEQPKIWNDILAALKAPEEASAIPPVATALTNAPPVATAPTNSEAQTSPNGINADTPTGIIPNTNASKPNPDAPSGIYLNTNAIVNSPKVFVPPDPLPAQPNWTWTVLGKDYHNVVVTKVEADRVHFTADDGMGSFAIADLTPNLQKMFNFDPELAAEAAQQKATALSEAEAAEAPKIEELKEKQKAEADAEAAATQNARPASTDTGASEQLQNRINFLERDIDEKQRALSLEGDSLYDRTRTHGSYDQIIADDKKELASYGIYH